MIDEMVIDGEVGMFTEKTVGAEVDEEGYLVFTDTVAVTGDEEYIVL